MKRFAFRSLATALSLGVLSCLGIFARAQIAEDISSLDCGALAGAANLLDESDATFLVFGNIPGTREAPTEFGKIVCEAAKRGPVIVGIERPGGIARAMQTYVDSDGSDDARFNILRTFFDGTDNSASNQAMLDLFIHLRGLRESGGDLLMTGFRNGELGPDGGQTPYEKGLAQSLIEVSQAYPDARVLVLTGNIHARKQTLEAIGDGRSFDPMVAHLPLNETLSFNFKHGGGEAYGCMNGTCGPHAVTAIGGHSAPGISFSKVRDRYDGTWNVGVITASPHIGVR